MSINIQPSLRFGAHSGAQPGATHHPQFGAVQRVIFTPELEAKQQELLQAAFADDADDAKSWALIDEADRLAESDMADALGVSTEDVYSMTVGHPEELDGEYVIHNGPTDKTVTIPGIDETFPATHDGYLTALAKAGTRGIPLIPDVENAFARAAEKTVLDLNA